MSAPEHAGPELPGTTPEQAEPTPEQIAERQVRAGRATRGALAAILCLEALIVLLVPRAIAHTGTGLDSTKTVLLVVLAVLLVAVGAMLRRPWGIAVGSLFQLPVIATGLWVTTMFILGVVFLAIWLYLLNLRHELVGTPGGWRLLIS